MYVYKYIKLYVCVYVYMYKWMYVCGCMYIQYVCMKILNNMYVYKCIYLQKRGFPHNTEFATIGIIWCAWGSPRFHRRFTYSREYPLNLTQKGIKPMPTVTVYVCMYIYICMYATSLVQWQCHHPHPCEH